MTTSGFDLYLSITVSHHVKLVIQWDVVQKSTKNFVSISWPVFTRWLLHVCSLCVKVPIPTHFCYRFDTLNVVRYCRDSQNEHLWPETQYRPKNVIWMHDEKKQKYGKKKHKLGDWTSHIFAETTHVA